MVEDVMLYWQDKLQELFDSKCFIPADFGTWSNPKGIRVDLDYGIIESPIRGS